jgi:hypothetical protein
MLVTTGNMKKGKDVWWMRWVRSIKLPLFVRFLLL